jgi:hypothetical protein
VTHTSSFRVLEGAVIASAIQALLATPVSGLRSAVGIDVPVIGLAQDVGMIPCTQQVRARLAPSSGQASRRGWNVPDELAELVREISHEIRVAYIEGETFGGEGTQSAAVWHRGELLLGPLFTCDVEDDAEDGFEWTPDPRQSAINLALRTLGVSNETAVDEYAALGLHLKRRTDDWLT